MQPASESLVVQVVHKRYETADVALFELAMPSGSDLPSFTAGAHIDVYLPGGAVRQYSLCNGPDETDRYLIGVLRSATSRGGSEAMHAQVMEGDLLTISTPRNLFPLHPAEHTLFFAGGIGITPILGMAEQLSKRGASFELHYCARSEEHAAFLKRLETSAYSDKVFIHFDDGAPSSHLDLPASLRSDHADTRLYVCGPQGFMDWVIGTARAQGWPADRIHSESFGGTSNAGVQGDSFEVELKRTGAVYTIAADKSVATVLLEAGFDIPVSCEAGVCGTCMTRVLEGEIDHRDSYLTDEERAKNDCFTPCCSRAHSPRIVLDL
ncbi:PDR/VanB family oxidoreductase [Marinobacterium sp. D7]|uniref:PDR/VanB family oxidoreductase n=1 Tax=Marinobacterium ramblicola TaxID=2849041 RepID=UPI001C2CCF4B|nr:PDR/VanB family oxidoreductase [Marinobacterium ramblicola]MBV1788493.1 PDR/VanB family oxidoreductase [Marinobacterium ramblicola]